MADKEPEEVTSQQVSANASADVTTESPRPLAANVITRTVSDSAAYAKRDIQKESRTRSVTFYDTYEERQKRKLQRTPTPYWPRKEVDLTDSCVRSSFDEDNPYPDSPSGLVTFSPKVSFDDGDAPSSGSKTPSGLGTRRSLFKKSSSGGAVVSIDEEVDDVEHGSQLTQSREHARQPASVDDVASDVTQNDLYRNALFRRAVACHVERDPK